MTYDEMRLENAKLLVENDKLKQQVRDLRHLEFALENGRVVGWDGDVWLYDEDEDALIPLGHTRGGRHCERNEITPEEFYRVAVDWSANPGSL